MAHSFSNPPTSYAPQGLPESRWTKAKKEWDSRIGSARVQAYNWRLIAVGLLGLCVILTFGLIYQSSKSTVTPYVIEVDSTTGMARAIGPAKESTYKPKDAEIKYFLGQFILKTRTVPLDPVVWKQNWNTAYSFMRPNAANKMNTLVKNDTSVAMMGKQTVQPIVVSTVAISENSYQVRWTEETFSLEGGSKSITPMTGIFTIEFGQPKNEKELQVNPLGLFIKDFNWAKDNK